MVWVAVIVVGCARDWYQLLTRRKAVELHECPYVPLARRGVGFGAAARALEGLGD